MGLDHDAEVAAVAVRGQGEVRPASSGAEVAVGTVQVPPSRLRELCEVRALPELRDAARLSVDNVVPGPGLKRPEQRRAAVNELRVVCWWQQSRQTTRVLRCGEMVGQTKLLDSQADQIAHQSISAVLRALL